jgi:uncharacterized protein (TIGR03085 family)
MTSSLARRERRALCDLALVLGEDAPTLSGEWTAKDLVVHLLVREYSPLGAAGLVVGPLSRITDLEMRRVGRHDFGVLVERLRGRGLTAYSVPLVDRLFNTLEYFVHHEDLRRAQPGWQPRELDRADTDELWRAVRLYGRGLVRGAHVPVRLRRTDTGATMSLHHGRDPVEVAGPVGEIALFLFGRDRTRGLDLVGAPERVAGVRGASRGI